MPFGLAGAPGVFMNLINDVLKKKKLYKAAVVYIDDVLLYSETMEEHVALVRDVLKTLARCSLFVKLSKCEFHKTELFFLGYKVLAAGVRMDPTKVKDMVNWEPLCTRRQFGLC